MTNVPVTNCASITTAGKAAATMTTAVVARFVLRKPVSGSVALMIAVGMAQFA